MELLLKAIKEGKRMDKIGQVRRQFSDESDNARGVKPDAGDSLYGPPRARRPAGGLEGLPEDIAKAKEQAEGSQSGESE